MTVTPRDSSCATQLPDGFIDVQVVGGLDGPVGFDFLPDGRLLFTELLTGRIRMIVGSALGSIDPLITVDSLETLGYERGLTGIAVDPGWPARPYVYTCYSALGFTIRVSRFTVSGDLSDPLSSNLVIDPASRHDVLRGLVDQTVSHNGGTLRFGPDGMLYLTTGDDFDFCSATDTTALAGALLRMDVGQIPAGPGIVLDRASIAPADNPFAQHPDPSARLVWAMGFRNPFRFHIDPLSGEAFVGDVGARAFEEINHVTGPGMNFGWPYFEGSMATGYCQPPPAGLANPFYSYDRVDFKGDGRAAVISAGVYREPDCRRCGFDAEYEGSYFVSDFYEGFLRRMVQVSGSWQLAAPVPGQPTATDWGLGFERVADYRVGPDGALWFARASAGSGVWVNSGSINRIELEPATVGVSEQRHDLSFTHGPMPARDEVHFTVTLAVDARVALQLFDASGRKVQTLAPPASVTAGTHRWKWNGRDQRGSQVAPGIYLARLTVDGQVLTRRVALIR